eukprot:UC1_evm2s1280
MEARKAMMARQRELAAKKRAKRNNSVKSTGIQTNEVKRPMMRRQSSLGGAADLTGSAAADIDAASASAAVASLNGSSISVSGVGGSGNGIASASALDGMRSSLGGALGDNKISGGGDGAGMSSGGGGGGSDMSKFEMKMKEQAFEDVYHPEELRFEPVAPIAEADVSATLEAEHPGASKSDLDISDLEAFVMHPAPQGSVVKCRIIRDRKGVDKGMFPTYFVKLEQPDGDQVRLKFLLAGRKRKKSKSSNYIITTDPTEMQRDSPSYCGKLRSNLLGTKFQLFDDGLSADKASKSDTADGMRVRQELCAIHYETNVMGFKGPRKMQVLLPPVDEKTQEREAIYDGAPDALGKRLKQDRLDEIFLLGNKRPVWNESSRGYVLNFGGRVTQASVKNFQIVHESDEEYVVLQFGRIDDHEFTMDYRYPMSAVQAFGICLSSFDGKLACE